MAKDGDPRDATAAQAGRDLVYVHSQAENGSYNVIRRRADRLEIGEMRTPEEGKPLMGELVRLERAEDHQNLFHCETLVEAPTAADAELPIRRSQGPAQVSSAAYRAGWDQIFGRQSADPDPSKLN